jgi:hypothetical protein
MKLPGAERAVVKLEKLTEYSLNPAHDKGGHKARVFAVALGITINDAEWLREKLLRLALEGEAILTKTSIFGTHYVIDALITRGERSAVVRTAWIIEAGGDFPRLTSCYVRGKR